MPPPMYLRSPCSSAPHASCTCLLAAPAVLREQPWNDSRLGAEWQSRAGREGRREGEQERTPGKQRQRRRQRRGHEEAVLRGDQAQESKKFPGKQNGNSEGLRLEWREDEWRKQKGSQEQGTSSTSRALGSRSLQQKRSE
eukprot:765098-Hanusia_phi.AAC.1